MRATVSRLLCVSLLLCLAARMATGQRAVRTASDPAAVALVDRALEALGGAQKWQGMGAARLEGTVQEHSREGGAGKRYAFASRHDWSSGKFDSHHDLSDGQGQAVETYDPDKVFTPEQVAASHGKPRYAGAEVHAALVPGAMLRMIRHSGRYRMAQASHPEWLPEGQVAVNVYSLDPQETGRIAQTWIFSTATGLPVRAQITIPHRHGVPLYKEITFNSFQKVNGVMLPKSATVEYPDSGRQSMTFDAVQMVPTKRDK